MTEIVYAGKTVKEWLEEGMGGYTLEELQEAFRAVRNPEHWKMDIDATVDAKLGAILEYAVPWHTGGMPPYVEHLKDGKIRVMADGYWSNGMEGGRGA